MKLKTLYLVRHGLSWRKKRNWTKGGTNNLSDGCLIDLTNNQDPEIFVVENDLSSHQQLKHIAVQVLEFSLSFKASKVKVKNIIKEMLQKMSSRLTHFSALFMRPTAFACNSAARIAFTCLVAPSIGSVTIS